MVQGIICICDKDPIYTKLLLQQFQLSREINVNLVVVKEADRIKEYLVHNKIQLFLIQQELYDEITKELSADLLNKIVVLVEQKENQYKEVETIFKYQKSTNIIKSVMKKFCEGLDKNKEKKRNIQLIGVFSPCNQVCTTYYSQLISDAMSQTKSTLYLNLQLFTKRTSEDKDKYNMSDLIYQLNTKTLGEENRISLLCDKRNKVDYLLPVNDSRDLFSLTNSDLNYFFDWLCCYTGYEVICIGFDYIHTFTGELLERCDCLFTPVTFGNLALEKYEAFKDMLLLEEKEDIVYRILTWNTDETHMMQSEQARQQEIQAIIAQLHAHRIDK